MTLQNDKTHDEMVYQRRKFKLAESQKTIFILNAHINFKLTRLNQNKNFLASLSAY